MYPISNEVKALFEAEQRKVLRITGNALKKAISVGPSGLVTVNDAAPIPAKDITIAINLVQDLNGYEHPWPAGGGKNLFNIAGLSAGNGVTKTVENNKLTIHADGTSGNYQYVNFGSSANLRFPAGTYYVKYNVISNTNPNLSYQYVCFRNSSNLIQRPTTDLSIGQHSFTITTTVPCYFSVLVNGEGSNREVEVVLENIMVSTTDSAFEPYSNVCPISGWTGANVVVSPTATAGDGTTHPISWQSTAGTVYGGMLDVTTGLLTVTMAEVDLGTLAWGYNGTNFYCTSLDSSKKPGRGNLICSNYKVNVDGSIGTAPDKIIRGDNSNGNIYVKDSSYIDAATFKTAMSGVQLVYELATPITYQLTPTEVTLLAGTNNVWADMGETTLTYYPGVDLTITDNDVIANTFAIDRYSCNGEKLKIGTAIAAQMSLKLENGDGRYNGIVFEGAELFAEIGITDWESLTLQPWTDNNGNPITDNNGNIIYFLAGSAPMTWVPLGRFTPDVQPRRMTTISLTCMDRMTRFDKIVDATVLNFPMTVAELVGRVCAICNVPFGQVLSAFPNYDYSITALPDMSTDITYRNLIQWCAGLMGTNAWMDWNGALRFSWYDNTTGYVSTIDNRYSSDLYENAITITGVEYVDTDEDRTVYLAGTDDYALDVSGNGFINADNAATVLAGIYSAVQSFVYTPFTAGVIAAPYLWPMDRMLFTDKDGNTHVSSLTNVNFGVNGTTALMAVGMTEQVNAVTVGGSGFTKDQIQELRNIQRVNSDNLKNAVDAATALITGADGGYVRFIYDGDILTEIVIMDTDDITTATKVWRWNSGGLGYSSNGYNGPYTLAMTQNGAIVANFITAGEMSCDRLQGGTLTLGGANNGNGVMQVLDANGNVIGTWNNNGITLNKGTIAGPSVILGGANNVNGMMQVLDASGNVIGTWNKDGVNISKGSLLLMFDSNGSTVSLGSAAGMPLCATYYVDNKTYDTYISGNNFVLTDNDSEAVLSNIGLILSRETQDGSNPFVQCIDRVRGIAASINAGQVIVNDGTNLTNISASGITTPSLSLDNPLLVGYGGTGATTAAGARANIGNGCPSGTFTTVDGKTITVTNGFITAIT